MARQVKSVSIPERLQEQVADIPNFTGWVIEALDNPSTSAAVDSAALNRRNHLRHLDWVQEDLQTIINDLGTLLDNRSGAWVPAKLVTRLRTAVKNIKEDYGCLAQEHRTKA